MILLLCQAIFELSRDLVLFIFCFLFFGCAIRSIRSNRSTCSLELVTCSLERLRLAVSVFYFEIMGLWRRTYDLFSYRGILRLIYFSGSYTYL